MSLLKHEGSKLGVIVVLGTTQTLAWASSYYLPAIIADRISAELGISSNWFFAAFSGSLVVSAMVGPRVGRTIDAIGGREVLAASNVIIAAGLAALAFAHSQAMLWFAWLILGLGMGVGLYDTAFATLGRIYGTDARSAITGITLIAGFASTIGWPLTAWGASELGWRETCLAWSAAHLLFGLPLNYFLLPNPSNIALSTETSGKPHVPIDRRMIVLGFAFAASWMVVAAMAVHLPRLLEAAGATTVQAVAAGALIGPAQVGARILEASLLKRFHPMISARLSVALHPIGAVVLASSVLPGIKRIRRIARCGQWHSHHRARNGATGHVRTGKLRLPPRTARRALSCRDGSSAAALRHTYRMVWCGCALLLIGPQRCGATGSLHAVDQTAEVWMISRRNISFLATRK